MYELSIRTRNGQKVPAHLVSDGVLLYLGYLVLVHSAPRPSVLMLDEPESGLHPRAVGRLVDLFRRAARGEIGGGPVQIIAATQSPDFLNYVDPDCIRVVTREADGTRVTSFESAPNFAKLFEHLGPGEIWANFGERYFTHGEGPDIDG